MEAVSGWCDNESIASTSDREPLLENREKPVEEIDEKVLYLVTTYCPDFDTMCTRS